MFVVSIIIDVALIQNLSMHSSDTVMYNLFSACAYCQGGEPSDFNTWTESCISPVQYMTFPQISLGVSVNTPLWAFTNVTSDGTFDLISIQKGMCMLWFSWSTVVLTAGCSSCIARLQQMVHSPDCLTNSDRCRNARCRRHSGFVLAA